MTQTQETTDLPVTKSVTVRAQPDRAFEIFTREMDSWWPRSHHIGKSPMKRVIIEPNDIGVVDFEGACAEKTERGVTLHRAEGDMRFVRLGGD